MKHDKLITIRTSELVFAIRKTLETCYGPLDRVLATQADIDVANERELADAAMITLLGIVERMNHNQEPGELDG